MELKIISADNGYILTYHEEIEKGVWEERHIAVEDVEQGKDCISEARLTQKLLFEIIEFFNLFGSKHDTERCYVVLKDQKGNEIEL